MSSFSEDPVEHVANVVRFFMHTLVNEGWVIKGVNVQVDVESPIEYVTVEII